jgi:hypothetical protein
MHQLWCSDRVRPASRAQHGRTQMPVDRRSRLPDLLAFEERAARLRMRSATRFLKRILRARSMTMMPARSEPRAAALAFDRVRFMSMAIPLGRNLLQSADLRAGCRSNE